VRSDVGIPVHLVAAHKEVAVGVDGAPLDGRTRKIYGRKPDPAFDDPGRIMQGALAHGFSVKGSVRLIDTFRDQVHALMTQEDDMTKDELLDALKSEKGQEILRSAVRAAVRHELRVATGPNDGSVPASTYFDGLRKDVTQIKDSVVQP